jgi:hypothetical protein
MIAQVHRPLQGRAMDSDEDKTRVTQVEFLLSTRGPIVFKRTVGSVSRATFADWEEEFTRHLGITPDETLAYRVTMEDLKTGQLYTATLVFSGEIVLVGHDAVGAVLFARASGI